MNAIGKSIRTGRYTDSFTQPICAGTERQNALPWAGFSCTMVNKTVLAQLSELLEKRELTKIAAGTIVEATEVTDHGNVYLLHVDT